jgi:hypothetical protein
MNIRFCEPMTVERRIKIYPFIIPETLFTAKEKMMALIQTVEPDKAEGKVKEICEFMQKNAGVIPAPLQLASASPRMLDMVWQSIQEFREQGDVYDFMRFLRIGFNKAAPPV